MQPRHTFGRPHSEVSNAYRPEEESWFGSYSPPADDVFDGFDDDFAGIPRTRWRSPGTPRASGASLRRRARPLLLGTARAIGVALMVVGALMAVWGFYFACIDDPFAAPRTTFNMVYGICKTFFTSGVFGVSGYLLRRVATTPARPFGWT